MNGVWICPICKEFFTDEEDSKKKHIEEEIKELKESLKMLREL